MTEQPSRNSLERIRTFSLFVTAAGVVIAGLYFLSSAMVPFVIAALFHFSLAPLIDWQRRKWGFPGWLAVTTTALAGLVVFVGVWVLIAVAVSEIASTMGDYQGKLTSLLEHIVSWLPLDRVGLPPEAVQSAVLAAPSEVLGGSVTFSAVGTLIAQGALTALFLLFMLAGKAKFKARGPEFLRKVESSIQRYVVLKLFLSAGEGFTTWLILTVLGVEMALVFGVMAFLLNFIPSIGSITASLLPLPVLLLGDYTVATIILAVALPSFVQIVTGNLVEPKLFGKSLGIHPVVVMLTLVLFGLLWGIAGMFLATPLTAILKIMLDEHQYTKSIARLIEGDLTAFGGASNGERANEGT